ncbi:unnamed protein product [Gordionus sp. m RMFG-2023]
MNPSFERVQNVAVAKSHSYVITVNEEDEDNKPSSIYGRRRKSNPLIHAHFDPNIENMTPKIITRLKKDLDMMIEGFEKISKEKGILREELEKLNHSKANIWNELNRAKQMLNQIRAKKKLAVVDPLSAGFPSSDELDQEWYESKEINEFLEKNQEIIFNNPEYGNKFNEIERRFRKLMVSGDNSKVRSAFKKDIFDIHETNMDLYKKILDRRTQELNTRAKINSIKEDNKKIYRENIKLQNKLKRNSYDYRSMKLEK